MEKTSFYANVAFIGNPNCGKTTLFNAYTGANLKVANWPGVTVEKKEGTTTYHDKKYKLVDLPGIYSLTSYTMEEKLSREFILSDDLDLVVDIADASCLERNLYLTLQLIELGKPVVLVLNMMDIVQERGMEIDLHRLPEMLGIPVIPISARKNIGLDVLMHAVSHHVGKGIDPLEHNHKTKNASKHKHDHHKDTVVVYSDEIEDKIDQIGDRITSKYGKIQNLRWVCLKFLEMDKTILETYEIDYSDILTRSYESDIINQKYDFISEIIDEVLLNKNKKAATTDKADKYLTHRFLGIPIFLAIMAFVFFLTFTIGDAFKSLFVVGLDSFSNYVLTLFNSLGVNDVLTSLVVNGIIAGVGGILTFLPNIIVLFFALGLLEDSGYMSRVAYVMDGLMSKLGLSGKAFIPMILGFGCTVPAVMASRALENEKDRLKTILITPFMSCSARLPIYVLFSEMFFPDNSMLVAYSMYILGLVVAILIALLINKMNKTESSNTLLIELPEYKTPNPRTIWIYVYEKVKDYLGKAGTTIFIASIILWFLLNFNMNGMTQDISLSFGAKIGQVISPIFAPAGLGLWQISVALIAGLSAKEVVVSSFSVLFSINNINSAAGMNTLVTALSSYGFTSLNAYCLMVFCLLYTPCMAAVATIKKETNSWKWTGFLIVFQLVVAWLVATAIYQIGSLI